MKFLGHSIERPSYVPMTAWLRHGPFAMWLVKASRPKRIVELGSHYGYSYFTFCQAVREAELQTECFAIDTWQGDEHSGFYGDEVFDTVHAENEKYADFSTLLRKTFSEALEDIEDGSVDLLHVDGRHFYEDVKEDFESWIPKLADRAIVLFHDTEVRERDFGVWQYWQELKEKNVGFNFSYQHGLGVLFWGGDLTEEVAQFRSLIETDFGRDAAIALFYALGQEIAEDHTRGVFASTAEQDRGSLSEQMALFENGEILPEDQVARFTPGSLAIAKTLVDAVSRATQLEQRILQLEEANRQNTTHNQNLQDELDESKALLDTATMENQNLRDELASINSRKGKAFNDYLTYKALTLVLSSKLPLSDRTRARFQRSAQKRNPKRMLLAHNDALVGVPEATRQLQPMRKTGSAQGGILYDSDKQNVLLVSHEASWTGAPILVQNIARELSERYNVTVLCLSGGGLIDAFAEVSVNVVVERKPKPGERSWKRLAKLLEENRFDFAVVNSVESRSILPLLKEVGVPTVALLHEFASYTLPRSAFIETINASDQIVFSTSLTLENAIQVTGLVPSHKVHVFPQGKCSVPVVSSTKDASNSKREQLKTRLRPVGADEDFLVVGLGTVQIRKGVDLFIEVARKTLASAGGDKVRFVWIGAGYNPDTDPNYSVYLQDQLERSGVADRVILLPETTEINYVYELADAFLLTSRLDPLPNVAIDSMLAGLPVLCFDKASGFPEILREGGLGKACVASYLDTSEMASRVLALASSSEEYLAVSVKSQALASSIFDIAKYVSQVEDLAKVAIQRRSNFEKDCLIIAEEIDFTPDFMLPSDRDSSSSLAAAKLYVKYYADGAYPRRPTPGFNQQIYDSGRGNGAHNVTDAYADFIRSGRPSGLWVKDVLWGPVRKLDAEAATGLRCAMHIHAYYLEEFPRILEHLNANKTRPSLYVSVVGPQAKETVERMLKDYDGAFDVRTVPNLGRDIGPFLTEFGLELVSNYDVVGHIHTKKSLALSDDRVVEKWRTLLFENVLGGSIGGAMLDRTLQAFIENPSLGLVFPSDPNILSWGKNQKLALDISERLGINELPEEFDFPIGTMFWMRSDVLKPFVLLGLKWSDYPREPISDDGTILHALERLFGIVPSSLQFDVAVTCVKGITR